MRLERFNQLLRELGIDVNLEFRKLSSNIINNFDIWKELEIEEVKATN